MTLDGWWREYCDSKGRRLAKATLSRYEHSMRKHVLPLLASTPIDELRHIDVQRMLLECPTRGTALQAKRALSAVLGQAVAEGIIERNPVEGRLEYPDGTRALVIAEDVDPFAVLSDSATVWDARTVMRAMPRLRGLPLEPCWLCMVGAGLRREEALALRWRDVRRRDGVVELAVWRARTERDGIKATKTARSIRVAQVAEPFGSRLMELEGAPDALVCDASVQNVSKRWANLWKPRGKNCPKTAAKGTMLVEPAVPYVPLSRMRATHESLMQQAGVLDSVNAAAHGHSREIAYRHYLAGDIRSATVTLQLLLDGENGSRHEVTAPPMCLVRPGGFEPSTIGLEVRRALSSVGQPVRWCIP